MLTLSKILVTGGAGFIGINLCKRLIDLGADVVVVDNLSSGHKEFLNELLGENLKIIVGDVCNSSLIRAAAKDVELIFHLAADTDVQLSMEKPRYDVSVNVLGTLNVLEAAKKKKTKIVFTSSAAVYGYPTHLPVSEDHRLNPISGYGISKLAAEHYCRVYANYYSIPTIILRLFNVYGAYATRYVVYDFLNKLQKDQFNLEIIGDGNQTKDFIHISDTLDALLFAAENASKQVEMYNVGTGKATRVKELVENILVLLGLTEKTKLNFTGKTWKGDITLMQADVGKARRRLGFKPKVSLTEGLKKTISWYQNTYGSIIK